MTHDQLHDLIQNSPTEPNEASLARLLCICERLNDRIGRLEKGPNRITVEVEGGVVIAVYADNAQGLEAFVLDHDNAAIGRPDLEQTRIAEGRP